MVVKRMFRDKTKQMEYVLLSRKTGRPLKWFGTKKPTEREIGKEEERIQRFRRMREKNR